jgi:hypothetical protein
MKINGGTLLGIVGLALGSSTAMADAGWTQGPSPSPSLAPAASGSTTGGAIVAVIVVGLLVTTAVTVRLYDVRRRREAEAAALQGRISDALEADWLLASLTIVPTVRVPFRASAPATVAMTGVAPTVDLREAAIRVATRTMAQARRSFRVEDRVVVDAKQSDHAA